MAHYRFVSIWHFEAPLSVVWAEIFNSTAWPEWWKGVEQAEIIKEIKANNGVGSVIRYTWRSLIPYSLTFDLEVKEIEANRRIRGHATGDLVGWGTWTFSAVAGVTTVQYDWDVSTTKPWMNLVAPFARPIFHWAHDWVMRQGEVGLKKRLAGLAQHPQAKK